MFGTSGVRGRVGEDVTAEIALAVGRAVATRGNDRIVVGRDSRDSGRMLLDAVCAGATECGSDVIDLGIVPTPTVARNVQWLNADAGVMVTASHNPPEDNGLKLWSGDGSAFDSRRRDEIESTVAAESYAFAEWDAVGWRRTRRDRALERHRERLLSAVDIDGDAKLSVVVDVGNGTGGLTADTLCTAGCSVETLNAQPDGRFPGRPSEPTEEACGSLSALVAATDADLGIAHDGDADRTVAVDERGRVVSGDVLLALFAGAEASNGDVVVAPLNTSVAVDEALESVGAELVRTRVGDVHVADRAGEVDAVFGGEPSGAWIWPAETPCPDGPLAACKLVEMVARDGPLSELVEGIPTYPIRRDAIPVDDAAAVMTRTRDRLLDRYSTVTTLDGVRVSTDDGWFLVRASGTQPLVRITAQTRSETTTEELLGTARSVVESALSEQATGADVPDDGSTGERSENETSPTEDSNDDTSILNRTHGES